MTALYAGSDADDHVGAVGVRAGLGRGSQRDIEHQRAVVRRRAGMEAS